MDGADSVLTGWGSSTDASVEDLRSAFANAPIGMAVLTTTGVVTVANAQLGALLGRSPHELPGTTLFEVCHPDDLEMARRNCTLMTAGLRAVIRHECRFLRSDGDLVWVLVSTSRVAGTPERRSHLIMHVEDITDRKRLEAQLTHQALHDPLTGLGNRALLSSRIADVFREVDRARVDSLLILDLDGFKGVNDTYGHPAGDRLLQELAARLTQLLRPTDLAARLGGDEFAVLCVDTDHEQAVGIADRLRAAAATPFAVGGHAITLAAAVGIATRRRERADEDAVVAMATMMQEADRAMYDEKRRGREVSPSASSGGSAAAAG